VEVLHCPSPFQEGPSEGVTGSGEPWLPPAATTVGTSCSHLFEEPHWDKALIPEKTMLSF